MSITTYHAGPRFGAASSNFSVSALARLVHAMLTRQRTRKALAELQDQHLADVGISREQALAEAVKPFWVR